MTVTSNPITAGGNVPSIYNTITIPSAPSVAIGTSVFVTDALLPALLSNVTGGGAVTVRVFSDGTNWKVG